MLIATVSLLVHPASDSRVARAATPGRIAFGHSGDIWVSDNGSNAAVTQGGRYWGQPDWSPDGSHLALVGWNQNSTDIFTMADDGTGLRQITHNQASRTQANEWAFFPHWSPDGQKLAYLSDRTSQYTMLWTMNPDGSNQRQLTRPLANLDAYDAFAWSPDGTQIAATGFNGTSSQIYLVNLTNPNAPRAITSETDGALDPSWSPDGRWIAYAAREGKHYAIRVVDLEDSGPPTTLFEADMARSPRWAPSGGALAYIGLAGAEFELFVVNIGFDSNGQMTGSRPTQLTNHFGVDATSGLSWAP